MSQVRTHGPFVIFLNQADDYECCSPGIVLLFEIVFYVKDEESSGDEGETADICMQRQGTSGQATRGEERFDLIVVEKKKRPRVAIIEWIPMGLSLLE